MGCDNDLMVGGCHLHRFSIRPDRVARYITGAQLPNETTQVDAIGRQADRHGTLGCLLYTSDAADE